MKRKTTIQYYRARRAQIIDQLGGKCYICGSTHSLEFHHVDGNGRSHRIGGWQQIYKIQKELEQGVEIILVCSNCHKQVEKKGVDKILQEYGLCTRKRIKIHRTNMFRQARLCDLYTTSPKFEDSRTCLFCFFMKFPLGGRV